MASLEKYIHHGQIPTVVYVGMKSALNSVSYTVIVESIAALGLGGRLYSWISRYLERQERFMSPPEGPTSSYSINKRAPQGAVMIPLLFNITLIDLKRMLPPGVKITIYADAICI